MGDNGLVSPPYPPLHTYDSLAPFTSTSNIRIFHTAEKFLLHFRIRFPFVLYISVNSHRHLEQETLSSQVESGAVVPPGHGGLRPRRHPHALGRVHPQLPAGEQVLARGNGLSTLGYRVHGQLTHDGAERRARVARRRGRRRRATHAHGLAAVRHLRDVYDLVSAKLKDICQNVAIFLPFSRGKEQKKVFAARFVIFREKSRNLSSKRQKSPLKFEIKKFRLFC